MSSDMPINNEPKAAGEPLAAHLSGTDGEKGPNEASGVIVISATEEKHILRKIDLHLLPLMVVLYMLQYLDKTALSYAAIIGIQGDTHLVGQEYSWVSSLFYFGYLVASPIASVAFIKFPLGRTIVISTILWSIVLACHGAANSFASLGALRFLLGVFEAAISPGFSLITSMWYKPSEHSSRHGFWFVGNGTAGFFGGILSYAIGHINSGLASWRWIFIIFGLVTFFWSIMLLFFLPNSPADARFLTPDQRDAAAIRVQQLQHSNKTSEWKLDQLLEALMDPKTWLLFSYAFLSSVPNGGLTNFGSIIVLEFGYSIFQTLLLGTTSAAFQILWVLAGTLIAANVPKARCIIMAALNVFSLVGIIMVKELPTTMRLSRLGGLWLATGFAGGFPLCLSLVASNTAGYTKKTTVSAIFFVGYCVGNIVGPQTFYSSEAPAYPSAYTCMIACFALSVVVSIALRQTMVLMNKRKDRKYGESLDTTTPIEGDNVAKSPVEWLHIDETDWKNRGMRYSL